MLCYPCKNLTNHLRDWSGLAARVVRGLFVLLWLGWLSWPPNSPVEPQWSVAVHREASHASVWLQISIKEAVQSSGSLVSSNFLPWRSPINCPYLICGLVQQAIFFSIPDSRHVSQNAISSLPLHQATHVFSLHSWPAIARGEGEKKEISMEISCLQSLCLKGAGRCLRTLAASQTEKTRAWFPQETHIPPCNGGLRKYHVKGI